MSVEGNRFIAVWASYELRARVWFGVAAVSVALLALSLTANIQAWRKPREVIRIGCDGIPQAVRIEEPAYSEPSELELRAFAAQFGALFLRRDSYSVRHDYVWCAKRMAAELQEAFKAEARGQPGQPGAIVVIESLKQRAEVDTGELEIAVDKSVYPWLAAVKGKRQVAREGEDGNTTTVAEPVALNLEVVRTRRTEELPAGLLVWKLHSRGEPLRTPQMERPRGE